MKKVKSHHDFVDQINAVKEAAKAIFNFPLKEKLNIRPAEKKWSAIEHIEHMNRLVELYFKQMDLSRSRKLISISKNEYKPSFLGNLFIKFMEPPPKIKIKTFKVFKPMNQALSEVEQDFIKLRDEFVQRVDAAFGTGTIKNKLSSPASSLLKFEVGEAFLMLAAHDRRHLFAINNLINQL